MARYVGDQNQVVLFHVSGTYATASGNAQWLGLVTNHNPQDTKNTTALRYTGQATRNIGQWVDAGRTVEGTLTFHPQDWKLLGFALGSVVDAGSPSPYTHTILERNNDTSWPYVSGTLSPFANFNIEDSKTAPGTGLNFVRTVRGAIVNEWKLNWDQGGVVECEVGYVAQDIAYSSGARSSVTADTARPFLWRDIKVHIPSGTVVQTVNQGTFTIANNLNTDTFYSNGSEVRQPMIPENRDYTLELTKHSDSEWAKTMYDQYYIGGSQFNTFIEIVDTVATAGSRSCYITLSGCRLDPFASPSPMEGTNEDTLTIKPTSCSVLVNDTNEKYNPW